MQTASEQSIATDRMHIVATNRKTSTTGGAFGTGLDIDMSAATQQIRQDAGLPSFL